MTFKVVYNLYFLMYCIMFITFTNDNNYTLIRNKKMFYQRKRFTLHLYSHYDGGNV